MKPRLIVEQKITAFVNKYAIYSVQPDGSKGEIVAFAQQKRIAIKEKIEFYTDESKSQKVFSLRAEKVMDIHGRYFVEDENDQRVGAFKKQFRASLLNSTWAILDDNDQPAITIKESNMVLALMRRFVGWIPFVGDFLEIIVLFFRYHFIFSDTQGNPVGKYTKTKLFRDHYSLTFTDDAYAAQDWRVLAAMSVGLDALQSR